MYFDDESEANASDPVLDLIEQAHRRETLIAPKAGAKYIFDILLLGERETSFRRSTLNYLRGSEEILHSP